MQLNLKGESVDTPVETKASKPNTSVPRTAAPVDMGYVKLCQAYTLRLAKTRDTH